MANIYFCTSLANGAGALTYLDGDILADKDGALVLGDGYGDIYELDANSGATESSPNILAPLVNAGTKRWLRKNRFIANSVMAADGSGYISPLTVGASTVVGRKSTGGIVAITISELLSLIGAVSNEAYSVGWSGITTIAPSKDAVYDEIEVVRTLVGTKVSNTAYSSAWDGITDVSPSKNAIYDKMETMQPVTANVANTVMGRKATGGVVNLTNDDIISIIVGDTYVMPRILSTNTAAQNAILLQAAIDSNASVLVLPRGTFTYDTGLTINRAIRVDGGGSTGRNTGTGTAMTRLQYTGAGIGLTLDGESANGTYNIHLSNFSLLGNANANGGILIGASATTPVVLSSLKNINIDLFNKVGVYGLKLARCQQTIFENVHARQNYNGIWADGLNTTLTFINCHAISNAARGFVIAGLVGGSFLQCLGESNGVSGLLVYSSGANSLNFYSFHSESNVATTVINGSGDDGSATNINFWGGYFGEEVSGRTINLDYASHCTFHDVTVPGLSYIEVTDHTANCVWETTSRTAVGAGITGNASDRMNLIVPTYPV
jgi:hypothetical protein